MFYFISRKILSRIEPQSKCHIARVRCIYTYMIVIEIFVVITVLLCKSIMKPNLYVWILIILKLKRQSLTGISKKTLSVCVLILCRISTERHQCRTRMNLSNIYSTKKCLTIMVRKYGNLNKWNDRLSVSKFFYQLSKMLSDKIVNDWA